MRIYGCAYECCVKWLKLDCWFLKIYQLAEFNIKNEMSFSNIEQIILFSLMLVQKLKNIQSFIMKLKNNFLITKPWVKMIFHQAHRKQTRNLIVWISCGGYLCAKLPLFSEMLNVFWLVLTEVLEKKEYFLWLETDFRSHLKLDGSPNSIMRIKMSISESLTEAHQLRVTNGNHHLVYLKHASKELKSIMI